MSRRRVAGAASALLILCSGCGEDEIPASVIETTKPAESAPAEPQLPPLTPTKESFADVPIPAGAKHKAMLDGRFRYLIPVTPGEMIGYFKKYSLPASVELDGTATVLKDAVSKETKSKKKMVVVIRPSTPGWTQVEITPESEPAAAPRSEAETLNAAKQAYQNAL